MDSAAPEYLRPFDFLTTEYEFILERTGQGPLDNFFADFRSGNLMIRVIRDRKLYFMEFASPKEETKKFNLGDVLSVLKADTLPSQSLEAITASFKQNYDQIVRLFADENYTNTRNTLVAIGKDRLNKLIEKHKKNNS